MPATDTPTQAHAVKGRCLLRLSVEDPALIADALAALDAAIALDSKCNIGETAAFTQLLTVWWVQPLQLDGRLDTVEVSWLQLSKITRRRQHSSRN